MFTCGGRAFRPFRLVLVGKGRGKGKDFMSLLGWVCLYVRVCIPRQKGG